MELTDAFAFGIGLVLLVVGAESLVRGASALAASFGIPPLIIGLTVVAFGTSAPELAVSAGSAIRGDASIALGNVVGSNIANVLLILGMSAVITPLLVKSPVVRFDVPVMILASAVVFGLALDGSLGRTEGVALLAAAVLYIGALVRRARSEPAGVRQEFAASTPPGPTSHSRSAVMIVIGLAGLVSGSNLLLDAAVAFASRQGVSELVIGLTLVAVGTSLPEIATSVLAAVRGQRDIAVGNAIGSNIFNLLVVLGASAVVAIDGIDIPLGALDFDLPFMIAVAVACLPILSTGHVIARWEGLVFLGHYAAYATYLILEASEHDLLEPFSTALFLFVVPLTVVTLIISAMRSLRSPRSRSEVAD